MDAKPIFRKSDWSNLELARQIVLYRLRNDPQWHQFDYIWEERGSQFIEFEYPELRNRFLVLVNEVMWQLLIQGVITAGMNSSNPNLPFFRVTEYGQKVLEAGRFIPHDASGYLKELEALVGIVIGKTAIAYLEEALRCFNVGCHVASVLLLGVAAESVFLRLCDAIRSSLKDSNERSRLDDKLPVRPKHRWIVDKYQGLPGKVRREQLPESLDMTLLSLYELIRRQRNDLGHPQENPPELNREQAFVFFQLFPGFVGDLEAFAKYCHQNGI